MTKGKKKVFFGVSLVACLLELTLTAKALPSIPDMINTTGMAKGNLNTIFEAWKTGRNEYNTLVEKFKKDYVATRNAYISTANKITQACPNERVTLHLMSPEELSYLIPEFPSDSLTSSSVYYDFWRHFQSNMWSVVDGFNNTRNGLSINIQNCPKAQAVLPTDPILNGNYPQQFDRVAEKILSWPEKLRDMVHSYKSWTQQGFMEFLLYFQGIKDFSGRKTLCTSGACPETSKQFCSQLPDTQSLANTIGSFFSDGDSQDVKILYRAWDKMDNLLKQDLPKMLNQYNDFKDKCDQEKSKLASHAPAAQTRK